MGRILIVDDEASICWALNRMLQQQGHQATIASSAEEALDALNESTYDAVLLDVRLPGQSGLELLPRMLQRYPDLRVIVMTAFGDLNTAVSSVQGGAFEYLTKPFRLSEADAAIRKALESAGADATTGPWSRPTSAAPELIGSSPAIQRAYKQIALVADSPLSVLITGETGTGKELVAEAIHRHSSRRDRPYIPIAPVALNENLIESELFGHVRGAFTGATEDRAGLFERANGGTVLLDEIAELPMGMQAKLLRVLEKGEFFRVGDITPMQCDVRVLAATNRSLAEAVQRGTFREDLYYRLKGMHIHLPPLRERLEDIGPLCEYFLRRIHFPHPHPIDDKLLEELKQRPWYGNVRELKNAVEHAAVIARGRPLTIHDFPPPQPAALSSDSSDLRDAVRQAARQWALQRLQAGDCNDLLEDFQRVVEPELLRTVLGQVANNRAQAARLLGIHRGTLREKLRLYDLDNL